jgi:hypothetical protein
MLKRTFNDYTINGHYDENGRWQRTKFCLMSCGSACDCGPPHGIWYNPKYDLNKKDEQKDVGVENS